MEKTCGEIVNGFWYSSLDGKKLGDIIYIQDSEQGRRKQPFLIKAIADEPFGIYREYYIIQPNRRSTDEE